MIDLDISFFIQLANFIITLLVLNLLMFRPIREIIRRRAELMSDQLSKVENFNGQAETKVKDYEAALDSARKEEWKSGTTSKIREPLRNKHCSPRPESRSRDYEGSSRGGCS